MERSHSLSCTCGLGWSGPLPHGAKTPVRRETPYRRDLRASCAKRGRGRPASRFGLRLRRQEGKLSRDCFAAMWGVQQNVTECIRFEERNSFEGTGPPFPAAVQENGQTAAMVRGGQPEALRFKDRSDVTRMGTRTAGARRHAFADAAARRAGSCGQVRRKRPGQGGVAGIAGVGRKASASVRRGMRDGRGQSSFFLTDTRLTTCA